MARGRFDRCSSSLARLAVAVALVLSLLVPVATCAATESIEAARDRLRRAQASLEQALAAEEAAFGERDDFLRGHFDLIQSKLTQQSSEAAAKREEPKVNPKWQALDEQVRAIRRERESLLERLTPEHPQAIALDDRLAQATAARDAEPQLLVSETPSAEVLPGPTPGAATLAAADHAVGRFQELEAKCREAAAAVDRFDNEQREAHRALAALQAAEQRSQTRREASDSTSSQTLIWGGLMLAIGVGIVAVAGLHGRKQRPLSPKEIAGTLGVPLLGVVDTQRPSVAA